MTSLAEPTLAVLGPSPRGSGVALVRAVLDAPDARVTRVCPRCGSAEHGPVLISGTRTRHWVSLARSPSVTLVVVSTTGPVGVDLEAIGRADDAVLHRWTGVEAAVKATGLGLAIDPDAVQLVDGDWVGECAVAVPVGGSSALADIRSVHVPGHIARVALIRTGGGAVRHTPNPG